MAYLAAQRASNEARTRRGEAQSIFPNIRSYPGGGAPKPPQLHHDLKREIGGVGIVSGYGLTEAPIVVMATTEDPDQKLADTEGRPTPGVELIVVGLDGERAGPGQEGEIRLKGPQVIRGYLDPSLDADAFDDDGYFRSGDLGIVDAGRLRDHHRPAEGRDHPARREHLGQGGGGPPLRPSGRRRRGRHRPARPEDRGAGLRRGGGEGGRQFFASPPWGST